MMLTVLESTGNLTRKLETEKKVAVTPALSGFGHGATRNQDGFIFQWETVCSGEFIY
jgi:hypothetical protein